MKNKINDRNNKEIVIRKYSDINRDIYQQDIKSTQVYYYEHTNLILAIYNDTITYINITTNQINSVKYDLGTIHKIVFPENKTSFYVLGTIGFMELNHNFKRIFFQNISATDFTLSSNGKYVVFTMEDDTLEVYNFE